MSRKPELSRSVCRAPTCSMADNRIRIAVGQISQESDHFVSKPCELEMFRDSYLHEKEELFALSGTETEVAGILETLESDANVEIVPLIAARSNSAGPLSRDCYTYLRESLLSALKDARPVDGVILSHHGSMAAVFEDDPEGDIALEVRKTVGDDVPIVLTLDLHGNVTERMVVASNAILGYEHYPHDDVYSTGVRGASLLLKTVRGEIKPTIASARIPMLLTGFNGSTEGAGPFADLMKTAKRLEAEAGVLSASLFLVGSYLDVPDIGCTAVVVTDGDSVLAVRKAQDLAMKFWRKRDSFLVDVVSVAEAVKRGREQAEGGPILLLDTADTTGGGAAGDSIALVRELIAASVSEPCFAVVVDPDAVQTCLRAGIGSEVSLALGHKIDPAWGDPLNVHGRVRRTSDGRFQYQGGPFGGTWGSMGPSAVLQIGSIEVLIMSKPTYDWADEQYRAVGMNPERAKFIGVKNMMNFRRGYRGLMANYYCLDLPGPTPPDMRLLDFKRVPRSHYPFDRGHDPPALQIHTSRH